jgi:hypothetical protein
MFLAPNDKGERVTIGEAYALLGLDVSSAIPDEVRERFRVLIRANHPDGKPSHQQALANETTRAIVEAYTLLCNEGFPRLLGSKRAVDATGPRYKRHAASQAESTDPLAWVDEVWRESVRNEAPETAITKAILRALWWGLGGSILLFIGIAMLAGTLGALSFRTIDAGWLFVFVFVAIGAIGARFALAAWSMGCEVVRYWNVFRHIASPVILNDVRWKVASRLGLIVVALSGTYVALIIMWNRR